MPAAPAAGLTKVRTNGTKRGDEDRAPAEAVEISASPLELAAAKEPAVDTANRIAPMPE